MTIGCHTGGVGVAGGEAGDEVDARLHHRGGVQVGGDRGGRGHRGREPEVERHERALRDRADEHQRDAPFGRRARDRLGDELGERARAAGDDEHHEADEHREAAERGDGERLQGRTAALLPTGVVADEEVREHARRLPEHEQQEHVVGGDEAEHHAREGEQQRGEPAERRLVVGEVVHAVEEHEGADARDDEREQQGERVEPERERDAELRDPGHELDHGLARHDTGQPGEQQHEHGGRHQCDHREDAAPEQPRGERRQERDGRERSEAGDHPPSSRSHRSVPPV